MSQKDKLVRCVRKMEELVPLHESSISGPLRMSCEANRKEEREFSSGETSFAHFTRLTLLFFSEEASLSIIYVLCIFFQVGIENGIIPFFSALFNFMEQILLKLKAK